MYSDKMSELGAGKKEKRKSHKESDSLLMAWEE